MFCHIALEKDSENKVYQNPEKYFEQCERKKAKHKLRFLI